MGLRLTWDLNLIGLEMMMKKNMVILIGDW